MTGIPACHMHKRVRTHTLTGVAESVTTLYYEAEKEKRGRASLMNARKTASR